MLKMRGTVQALPGASHIISSEKDIRNRTSSSCCRKLNQARHLHQETKHAICNKRSSTPLQEAIINPGPRSEKNHHPETSVFLRRT